MDKLTSVVHIASSSGTGGVLDAAEGATSTNESLCPSLSWKTRITGCAGCIILGMLFSILSWVTVFLGDYVFFGVLFTMGNCLSIGGTLFLAGPVRQVKNMFNESRWIATIVYLVMMVMTVLAAVLLHNGGLVIILCLLQYVAMWWYFLSYIPFARDMVKNAVRGAVSAS